MIDVNEFIKFTKTVGKSKKIKRTGWVREKIHEPESVAEHCFRLIVISMVLAPYLDVDQAKLVKMAIIHDLGETSVGDLVVERGKTKDEVSKLKKEKKEEQAIHELFRPLSDEYDPIFHEMLERKTKEAQIFWQLDKLEMAMQSTEYEKEQNKNLSEFYENAQTHITDPLLKEILENLKK